MSSSGAFMLLLENVLFMFCINKEKRSEIIFLKVIWLY